MSDQEPRAEAARSKRSCNDDSDMELWWEERSLAQKILLGIGLGVLIVGLLALFGWVVMLLWNWLMPEIFGLPRLSYWQSWGLLLLSCILFKDIDFGSNDSGRRSDRKRRRHLRRYMQAEPAEQPEEPGEPSEQRLV